MVELYDSARTFFERNSRMIAALRATGTKPDVRAEFIPHIPLCGIVRGLNFFRRKFTKSVACPPKFFIEKFGRVNTLDNIDIPHKKFQKVGRVKAGLER